MASRDDEAAFDPELHAALTELATRDGGAGVDAELLAGLTEWVMAPERAAFRDDLLRKGREAEEIHQPRDDEAAFEAAVDAEFQAALDEWHGGTYTTSVMKPQRDWIRDDLLRRRREAEEIHQLAEAERRRAAAEQEHVFREAALPPLPNDKQLGSFTHGTLQKAVKLWGEDGTTRGDVVRATKLPPPDARRVRLMGPETLNLLRLSDEGKLVVDKRVARKGSRYVLRYLDDTGTGWLDPDKALKGR